jgi:hypothetical protein
VVVLVHPQPDQEHLVAAKLVLAAECAAAGVTFDAVVGVEPERRSGDDARCVETIERRDTREHGVQHPGDADELLGRQGGCCGSDVTATEAAPQPKAAKDAAAAAASTGAEPSRRR